MALTLKRGIPKTAAEWGNLLYQISPLSMKAATVPLAQGIGQDINRMVTGRNEVPQVATDVGYALRGATNLTPFGGLGARQLIPQAGAYEPTTDRERAIQDVSQGLYGMALTAPAMAGGKVAAGLQKVATQTLPRTIGYAAGIGSTLQMGKNVLSGQVPALKRGGLTETLSGLTAGVPQAAARSVQYGIKLAPLMQGIQAGVSAIADKVPALNVLSDKSIQALKPQPGQTTGEWFGAIGKSGLARLVRATIIETPLESLVYGVANKLPKESLVKSIEREVLPNLVYNIGYAGMGTADDALQSVTPMIKEQVAAAIERMGAVEPPAALAGQAGFIGGPLMPGFAKGNQYVPLTEGEGATPRVMVSDKGAKLHVTDTAQPQVVGDVLTHPKLYKAYPDTAQIPVEFDPTTNESTTYFIGRVPDKIVLGTMDRTAAETKSDLLHEIQHTIQAQEGFAKGTSMAPTAQGIPGGNEYRNWINYMQQPGEAEARAVARMQNIPQSELAGTEPYAGDQYATRKLAIPGEDGTIGAMKNVPTAPDNSWAIQTLVNDENSSDQEMIQYFKQNGLSQEQSNALVALRAKIMTDPFSGMNGSPEMNAAEQILNMPQSQNPVPGATHEQTVQAMKQMKNIPSAPGEAPYHVTVYSGVRSPNGGGRWVMDEKFFTNPEEARAFADNYSGSMGPGNKPNQVEVTQDTDWHSFPGQAQLREMTSAPPTTFSQVTNWNQGTTRRAIQTVDDAIAELEHYGPEDAGLPRAKQLKATVADAWQSLLNNVQISPYEQQQMFGTGRLEQINQAVADHMEATSPIKIAKNIPQPKFTPETVKQAEDYLTETAWTDDRRSFAQNFMFEPKKIDRIRALVNTTYGSDYLDAEQTDAFISELNAMAKGKGKMFSDGAFDALVEKYVGDSSSQSASDLYDGLRMIQDGKLPAVPKVPPKAKAYLDWYESQLPGTAKNIPNAPSRDIEGEILAQEKIMQQLMDKQDRSKSIANVDKLQKEIDNIQATIEQLRAEDQADFQASQAETRRSIAEFQASPWKKNIDAELRRRWQAGDMSTDNLPVPPKAAVPKR